MLEVRQKQKEYLFKEFTFFFLEFEGDGRDQMIIPASETAAAAADLLADIRR